MRTIHRSLWACALVLAASSCNSVRAFEAAARAHGGHDGPGGEDLVFLELRNVDGVDAGAYALSVPQDWAERSVRTDEQGRLVPDPPCQLMLLPGSESVPALELAESGGEGPPEIYVRAGGSIPLLVIDRERALDPSTIEDEVRKRLSVGANAYALVHATPESVLLEADVYGARFAPGPSDAVEWIWLGDIRFEDARGFPARAGDVVLRQAPNAVLGTVAFAYLAGVFTSPIWIWFVI